VLLLALDTATPAVTVALHDGSAVIAESSATDARRHAELLAPLMERVLGQAGATAADLTDVAVGTGPGPFTGLRVGLVTARMTASALGLGLHGVSTLDVLAAQALEDGTVGRDTTAEFLVATDARRREVYWAAYRADGGAVGGDRGVDGAAPLPERIDGPYVARAADVPRDDRPVVGRGAELYAADLGPALGPLDPSAGALARLVVRRLALGTDLSDVEPLYLRRPDVHVAAGPKSVLG
jgi:tRNA threonylcarbamoyladenosine biosynthesis protein TsaB